MTPSPPRRFLGCLPSVNALTLRSRKGKAMASLHMGAPGELWLVLHGAAENVILTTVRRWPHWLRVEVERDPEDTTQCVSVKLVTGSDQEATLREILRRSFGLVFPPEGGSRPLTLPPVVKPQQRGSKPRLP